MSHSIPARVIQTARSADLPLMARACMVNVKALNPDFEHCFFDDRQVAEFVAREFPEYLSTFEGFPYRIQKYDFFRYLAVYRLGGFYFDLDVFFAGGLEPLLAHNCVFPFEELTLNRHLRREYGMDWEIGNYAFGAAAGHPFLRAVIENCVRGQREPGWVEPMLRGIPRMFRSDFVVLNSTGPGLVTRTLAENPGLAGDVKVLFPEDVCNPATWHQFGPYGVHAMEGSWRTRGNFLRRRLGLLWESWILRRYMAESRGRGKTRVQPAGVKAPVAAA